MTEAAQKQVLAAEWMERARVRFEEDLGRTLDRSELGPAAFAEAFRYALEGGGKRVRPALCRLVGEASGAEESEIVAAQVALECVHTYSLVHDDLPCMDDDELRRGRPTVHVRYGEATAVLVGDGLLTFAFEVLGEGRRAARTVPILARAAGAAGMVGGQVLDLAGEGRDLDAAAVEEIHRAKTAALLGAAAELGAAAGEASRESLAAARAFGRAIGMCFQATDDVLDVTGDAASLGKTPGKDVRAQKGTLVAALGLEGAQARAAEHAEEARRLAAVLGLGDLGEGLVGRLLGRQS